MIYMAVVNVLIPIVEPLQRHLDSIQPNNNTTTTTTIITHKPLKCQIRTPNNTGKKYFPTPATRHRHLWWCVTLPLSGGLSPHHRDNAPPKKLVLPAERRTLDTGHVIQVRVQSGDAVDIYACCLRYGLMRCQSGR